MPRRQERRRAEAARALQRIREDQRARQEELARLAQRHLLVAPVAVAPVLAQDGVIYLAAGNYQVVNGAMVHNAIAVSPLPTAASEVTARELLRSLLRPDQRAHFDANGWVRELAKSSTEYWIAPAWGGGVACFPQDGPPVMLCIHPRRPAPIGDVMASQLLAIRGNEAKFRDTAIGHVTDREMALIQIEGMARTNWPVVLAGGAWR